jgi:glutaredoxin-like protein
MLENKEGQSIPQVTFTLQENDQWVKRSSADIFNNKTVIVFSLPGAFTPTCSSSHLPRYNELAKTFADNGVDDIVCVSVNDTFVMNAWAAAQEADNITFLPDGNGDFTKAMGMLVDKSEIGFGKRSWRYSMLVKNGIIEKMFIEPNKPGDPFEVSDADTMLAYINPEATPPADVTIFTKNGCPYCRKAKALLAEQGLSYEEIVVGKDIKLKGLRAATGATTVPQVFIDGKLIGDSEQLSAYFTSK